MPNNKQAAGLRLQSHKANQLPIPDLSAFTQHDCVDLSDEGEAGVQPGEEFHDDEDE